MRLLKNPFNHQLKKGLAPSAARTREGLSRRSFLQGSASAAAVLAAPTLLTTLCSGQERGVNDPTGYTVLPEDDVRKILRYTVMIRMLQEENDSLLRRHHPEYLLDHSPKQQEIFKNGGPYEFQKGYLYHGRGNLGEVLLQDSLPKQSFVTRVPQVWALQPFVDLETDPAIFMIDALDFNRWQNHRKATLLLNPKDESGRSMYTAEPYPVINESFPLNSVLQILVTKETYDKYQKLVKQREDEPSKLSEQEIKIAANFKSLLDNKKIVSFDSSNANKLTPLSQRDRFVKLNQELEDYLESQKLLTQIPGFRQRTDTSTGDKDRSLDPSTVKEVNEESLNLVNEFFAGMDRDIKTLDQQERRSRVRKSTKEGNGSGWLRNTLTAAAAAALSFIGAGGVFHLIELRKDSDARNAESIIDEKATKKKKRKQSS